MVKTEGKKKNRKLGKKHIDQMKTGIKLLKVRGKQSFSGTEGNVKPSGK